MESSSETDVSVSEALHRSAEKKNIAIENCYVPANPRTPVKFYTKDEVAKHCTKDDCWVICDGKVYDVTAWMQRHPGGEAIILAVAGQDITDAFMVHHAGWVRDKMLPLHQIGYVRDYQQSEMSKDVCDLHIKLEQEQFYKTSYLFYVKSCLWYFLLFALSLWCIFKGRSVWIRTLLASIFMAAFWQQIAFFGHDLGHMAVTHDRKIDNFIGIIGGNLLMGIALGWWKSTHCIHHVVTNHLEDDPDIQHLPVFAITDRFFKHVYSTYHQRVFNFDKACQTLVKRQHLLFYPVMFVARFNLYLQSILLMFRISYAKAHGVHWPYFELVMLSGFYVWFSQLLRCFPTWKEAALFTFLSHGFAGVLHIQICISHFSMEVLEAERHGKTLEKLSFLEHQTRTSLDVDCPPWLDWFHGGLQFQTTHHLFPLAPRHKLRDLAATHVKKLCQKHHLVYAKQGFFAANLSVLRTLKATADKVSPWFSDLLHCRG